MNKRDYNGDSGDLPLLGWVKTYYYHKAGGLNIHENQRFILLGTFIFDS